MKRLKTADRVTKQQKVGIAEYAVVTDETQLSTSGLGSCLGIVFHDPQNGVSGLIHVMLPSAEDARDTNPLKFVDTGVPLLLKEMEAAGASRSAIQAWVVGGSEMLSFSAGDESIGSRNIAVAKRLLAQYQFEIIGTDVGGNHGRSMTFDPESPNVVIRTAAETVVTL